MALFTSESAAMMARKRWDAERLPKPELPSIPAACDETSNYINERLARVRKQIDMLSDMIESEEDASKIDRLANAITRLAGLEREYANRPLPGTLKPSSTKQSRAIAPLQPTPIPLAAGVSIPEQPTDTQQGETTK